MNEPVSVATKIQRAAWLRETMKHEVMVDALATMKWRCYEAFITAKNSEERIIAQCRAQNIEEFADELQIVLDAGEREQIILARDASRDEKKRRPV